MAKVRTRESSLSTLANQHHQLFTVRLTIAQKNLLTALLPKGVFLQETSTNRELTSLLKSTSGFPYRQSRSNSAHNPIDLTE